jgi:hypothetical protein
MLEKILIFNRRKKKKDEDVTDIAGGDALCK